MSFRSATRRRFGLERAILPLVPFAGAMLAVVGIARAARAEPLYGSSETFWQGQVGLRSTFVTDPGFDPFASDDVLTSFSLGVSRTVYDHEAFSLAPGIFWEYGARSSTARSQPTSLTSNRLAVALEARGHLAPWAYGFVRVAPTAIQQRAQLSDPLAAAPLVASAWTFGVDASAGAAFLLGPHSATSTAPLRWWLAAEGGYGYASSAPLLMHPDLASGDPRRTGDLDLGRIALGGVFFRLYGSVTF
jgi:hypothetical protein